MDYKEYKVYDNTIRCFPDNSFQKWGKISKNSKVGWVPCNFYRVDLPTNCYYWTILRDKEGKSRKFYRHRMIYRAYHPEFDLMNKSLIIDHISHTKEGDKIENLRCVTQLQNCWNRQKPFKGYSRNKWGKYQVRITDDNKRKSLGNFETEQEAAEVYKKAVEAKLKKLFNEYK